jgi:hypothetical protein
MESIHLMQKPAFLAQQLVIGIRDEIIGHFGDRLRPNPNPDLTFRYIRLDLN